MSNEQPNEPLSPKSQDKHHQWIATVVWLALLAANLITSYAAISAIMAGGLLTTFFSTFANSMQFDPTSPDSGERTLLVVISALLALIVIALLLAVWQAFASLSRVLFIAYAWLEEQTEEDTLFFDWLTFPQVYEQDAEQSEPDLDDAQGTLASDVVRRLGYTWATMLAMSPILSLVSVLL